MRVPSSGALWSSALLLSPTSAFTHHPSLRTRQSPDAPTFDWTTITPTPDLQYHPCYGGTLKCARLQVPLDWSKANTTTKEGPFAAIAILTLPAVVPSTSSAYAGPILINPGGPGGSGTEMALDLGSTMQALADVPGERHYDIIGFDPRGVAFTTPSAACYTSEFSRVMDALQVEGMPSVLTEQGVKVRFETARGTAKLCAETLGLGDGSALRHVSTASVARDMLEIVERSHELVMKEGEEVVGGKKGGKKETARLQYLGVSYGSILGNTFASMFPGRVGRMVVDGIADAEDYFKGAWEKNLNDAEAAIDIFYRTCFNAGEHCKLRSRSDRSATDIRARIATLLHSLQQTPVSTVHDGRVYIVSSYQVAEAIRTSLYTPINEYENLSVTLAEALNGNFTRILSNPAVMPKELPTDVCSTAPITSPPQAANNHINEAATAIICGDSQSSAGHRNLTWSQGTVARIIAQSSTVGEAWTKIPLACAEWPFAPLYSFTGPFGSPAPSPHNQHRKDKAPLAPLLILSTRTDHATPLANAFALSKLHGGSAVVVQESVGHCALMSSPSSCTIGIVREYFATGKVPRSGTLCMPDCVPEIPFRACPGLL